MKKVILFLLFILTVCFGETYDESPKYSADCLILKDENSIICKYEHERLDEDTQISVKWVNPQNEISRERTIVILAGHGSIYDFRYIQGRQKGTWKFIVTEGENVTETTFTIE